MSVLIWVIVAWFVADVGIVFLLHISNSSRCAVCGKKILDEQEGTMMLKDIRYVPVHSCCECKAILTGFAKSICAA